MHIHIHSNKYANLNFISTTAFTHNYYMQFNGAFGSIEPAPFQQRVISGLKPAHFKGKKCHYRMEVQYSTGNTWSIRVDVHRVKAFL